MRMLQSELERNRTATTVWFNAWHHHKEDQLLAYLLEAVQIQAAPSWFSFVGFGFRLSLLRVRTFSSAERFLATLAALSTLAFHSETASILQPLIPSRLEQSINPASITLLGAVLINVIFFLNQSQAFTTDPAELIGETGKSAWEFLKELVAFPSLKGRADVRWDFAKNLKEVTDALKPQRLVIFLDDLDRCPEDKVVQILEAVNFLSSAAECFVFLGADYRKVETLVACSLNPLLCMRPRTRSGVLPSKR